MILVVSNTQPGQMVASAIAEQHPVKIVPTTRYAVPLILQKQTDAVIVDVSRSSVENVDALFGIPDIPAVAILDESENLNRVIRAMQIGAKDYYVLSQHPVTDIVQRAVTLTKLSLPRQQPITSPIRLMPDRNLIICFSTPLPLSQLEFRAFSTLYRYHPNAVPYAELINAIGGGNLPPIAQYAQMRGVIMRLRNKLNLLNIPKFTISATRNVGYVLHLPRPYSQ